MEELTDEEKAFLIELFTDHTAYWDETLRMDHPTKAAAMQPLTRMLP